MSAIRASGAKRTSARGGVPARVSGDRRAIIQVQRGCLVRSVLALDQHGTDHAGLQQQRQRAAPADQATVRGDKPEKNSAIRVATRERHRRLAHGLSIDRIEQFLHGARGRCAQALVEVNGFGVFFPDHGILPGKLGIAGERLIDTARIARAQRAAACHGSSISMSLGS